MRQDVFNENDTPYQMPSSAFAKLLMSAFSNSITGKCFCKFLSFKLTYPPDLCWKYKSLGAYQMRRYFVTIHIWPLCLQSYY